MLSAHLGIVELLAIVQVVDCHFMLELALMVQTSRYVHFQALVHPSLTEGVPAMRESMHVEHIVCSASRHRSQNTSHPIGIHCETITSSQQTRSECKVTVSTLSCKHMTWMQVPMAQAPYCLRSCAEYYAHNRLPRLTCTSPRSPESPNGECAACPQTRLPVC